MLKATIGLWLLASICGLQMTNTFILSHQKTALEEFDYIQNATDEINQNSTELRIYSVEKKLSLRSYLILQYDAVCISFKSKVETKLNGVRVAMMIERDRGKDVEECYDNAEKEVNMIENSTISELQECIKIGLDYYDMYLEPVRNLENEAQEILSAFRIIFTPCIGPIPIEYSCIQKEIRKMKKRVDNFREEYISSFSQHDTAVYGGIRYSLSCLTDKANGTFFNITEVIKQSEICIRSTVKCL
ncbi:hypothetical protein KM043_018781 [Ampulex compressa]|nr:hypothetical protein KM043_018781 [Ampulex compressa]